MPPESVPVVMLSAFKFDKVATAATAYATAAQGLLAASALQTDSTLDADNMTTGTLSGGTY